MPRTRIGVIGCGYWGPNIVRTFLEIPEAHVVAVADRDPGRLDHIRVRHPQIEHLLLDHEELYDLELDAMVVATPPESHFALVRECIEQGLDVFVEKPLAITAQDARNLVAFAESRDRVLMVGHIAAYNPAVQTLKEMIDAGELGEIRYVDAIRAGLGLFHPSLNVIWDLAPHDVSIFMHILGESPSSVSTRGIACVQGSVEDVAYMALMFPSGVMAHTRMSWLDPCKTRRITVVGSKKMVVYDDLEVHEKIKVYDKRVNAIRHTETFGEFQFAYHYGSVVSPYIHFEEPLRLECQHFLECVEERQRPLTDGRAGLEVVRVIEAAQRSLQSGGLEVWVDGNRGPAGEHDLLVIREDELVGSNGGAAVSGNGWHPTDAETEILIDLTEARAAES